MEAEKVGGDRREEGRERRGGGRERSSVAVRVTLVCLLSLSERLDHGAVWRGLQRGEI